MRAIWKGSVSFGLVSVPVKLYSATESHDVSFRQVHAKDGGRIKYQRVCSIDGEEVEYADIAKGYETEDGEMVILTDDDMAALPSTSSREIAALLEKPVLTIPEPVLRAALAVGSRLGLTRYGPEQTMFLQYRPVLDNTRLKDVFGYTPSYTSAEAFEAWKVAHRL